VTNSTGPIPRPTPAQVSGYLAAWTADGDASMDAGLTELFTVMPGNADVGRVLVKVAALNSIYATGILATTRMAHHIVDLGVDARLVGEQSDADLVEQIARLDIDGTVRRNYSFATKYCSFHRPDLYPFYDSLVSGVSNTLLRQGDVFTVTRPASWGRDYDAWCQAVRDFRECFGLTGFSLRQIDKYLWKLAKQRQADQWLNRE